MEKKGRDRTAVEVVVSEIDRGEIARWVCREIGKQGQRLRKVIALLGSKAEIHNKEACESVRMQLSPVMARL